MLIRPPYFTGLTFNGYLTMLRSFNPYLLRPHLLVKPDLVPPLNDPPPTMQKSKPPLGPFRRSKCPFNHMLPLRTLLFVTLSKNGTMSSVGCLLPIPNIFRTWGHVYRLGEIVISLMVNLPTSFPTFLLIASCYLSSLFYFGLTLKTMFCSSRGELVS